MDQMMTNCGWEEIIAFASSGEYRRFVKWIEEQAERGECNEILGSSEVLAQRSDRRFQSKESGQIWKLSCPDPGYFAGSWLPESRL